MSQSPLSHHLEMTSNDFTAFCRSQCRSVAQDMSTLVLVRHLDVWPLHLSYERCCCLITFTKATPTHSEAVFSSFHLNVFGQIIVLAVLLNDICRTCVFLLSTDVSNVSLVFKLYFSHFTNPTHLTPSISPLVLCTEFKTNSQLSQPPQ